jgi:hypothetical protein
VIEISVGESERFLECLSCISSADVIRSNVYRMEVYVFFNSFKRCRLLCSLKLELIFFALPFTGCKLDPYLLSQLEYDSLYDIR